MATENKEIGDIVKKCKILLLDIEGTTTSISFVKDKLFPYVEENVKQFLDSQWEDEEVKEVVAALRKLALEDKEKSVDGFENIPGEDASKEEQIEGLVKNVKWQMSSDRKVGALKQLQGLVWKKGYEKGDIKAHIYEDVPPAVEQWHNVDGQKVYIYSSGSVQAQKLLFSQCQSGDMLPFIDGHFDTEVGAKQEAKSYENIVEKIGCNADDVLFLTDVVKEAEAARTAGMYSALVTREGNAPLTAEAQAAFPVLQSFAELSPTNKRKPEPQEEETPAKVAKIEAETDVKVSPVESEASESPKEEEKIEKMDVEDVPAEEPKPKKEEVIVEELTDSNEPVAPVVEMVPIVEEEVEEKETKTEQKQTDSGIEEPEKEVKSGDTDVPVIEETIIEEINETDKLEEVAEIEDLEPIVDEPAPAEDMEVLQNAGEVLEKECDEILSKVQDVTNLDNIPVKPLLNTIVEETMESDTTDSNDIVDRILDTEIDLEIKRTEMESKAETEVSGDAKPEVDGEKVDDASPTETNDNAEEKVKEHVDTLPEEKKESSAKEVDDVQTDKVNETENVSKTEAVVPTATETNVEANGVANNTEAKQETEKEEVKVETTPAENKAEVKEPQLNGKATNGEGKTANGDEKVGMNGDVSNDDEVKSRLTENGLNGTNGDSKDTEKGQGDCKIDTEATEIKVKTVQSSDEPPADPVEQPTEA